MSKCNKWKILFCFFAAAALMGCSKGYSTRFYAPVDMRSGIAKVVVLPFNNLSGDENAVAVIDTTLSSQISSFYGIEVISGEGLNKKLYEKRLNKDDFSSRLFAHKVAQVLEADAVVYGDILEYRYRRWVAKKKGLAEDPIVCIGARMISGKTGTVIWSSTEVVGDYGLFTTGSDPLSGVALGVGKKIVKSMRINEKK